MLNSYYPQLKTTVSELRAFRALDEKTLNKITPIFELTKANKTKYDKQGDVHKRLRDIKDFLGGRTFCLDLTTEEMLSNDHIDSLFDDQDDYSNWVNFIVEIKKEYGFNLVPFLLMFEDSTFECLKKQAERLLCEAEVEMVAIRVELAYIEYGGLLNEISKFVDSMGGKVTVFIDFKSIYGGFFARKLELFREELKRFFDFSGAATYVILSSSFPASIYDVFGSQKKGELSITELDFYNEIASEVESDLKYGDYALIYPMRNEKKTYNWTPRVDFPTTSSCHFYREKREEGGYASCAYYFYRSEVFKSEHIDCWGVNEIIAASESVPNGKSPSYWISVRANIHMSRMADKIFLK